jgi:hypothetical protein
MRRRAEKYPPSHWSAPQSQHNRMQRAPLLRVVPGCSRKSRTACLYNFSPHGYRLPIIPLSQTKAIQLATKSQYSHVGMILRHNGKLMVCEAVGPVKFTSVNSWIKRDVKRHFVIKRLKNADRILTRQNLAKLPSSALTFEGKKYDFVFSWSDEKLYCSELV